MRDFVQIGRPAPDPTAALLRAAALRTAGKSDTGWTASNRSGLDITSPESTARDSWKVPRTGSPAALARQAMQRLAERNAAFPETDAGPTIPCDMDQAVPVHEFPLQNFGSIAFHGFLSTAETRSDKCWGHRERLLKPQDMVGVELDLSSKTHRKLLPKYAWCVVPERPSDAGFPSSTDYPLDYGGVMAVLRHDVLQRSSWSYGDSLALYPNDSPRFRAHTFQENALRRDMVGSTHFLEAQVWGELTLEDVDHFVVTPGQKYGIDRQREYLGAHPEADGGEVGDFDRFVETCRRLEIPVYVGDVQTRLKRTRDETGAEVAPAFETQEVLVQGLPADQRPGVDREVLRSVLGRPEDQGGSDRVLPETGIFSTGATRDEQAKAFEAFQAAAMKAWLGE